jgi:hypothetical protein
MIFPPYASPFPDGATPPVLGAHERAMLTVLAQRPGKVVTNEVIAQRLGLPSLTPRRATELVGGINGALGTDAVVTVPRRGWMLSPYPDAPAVRSI